MRLPGWVLLSIATVLTLGAATGSAQTILDRIITTEANQPLIITKLDGQAIGQLAKAAGSQSIFGGAVRSTSSTVARSHGELCWEWEQLAPADEQFFSGRRHKVLFSVLGGGGYGFAIP